MIIIFLLFSAFFLTMNIRMSELFADKSSCLSDQEMDFTPQQRVVLIESKQGSIDVEQLIEYEDAGRLVFIPDRSSTNADELNLDPVIESQGFFNTIYSYFQSAVSSGFDNVQKWNSEKAIKLSMHDELEKAAKLYLGESTILMMGPYNEKTHVSNYGQREINDKVRVTFINGILNPLKVTLSTVSFISKTHGGVKVHYVFRPTYGWTWDISRAVIIKLAYQFGFRSIHAHMLAQLWRDLIQEMGGIDGGGCVLHYGHSLGGSETDRARGLLTPEEQKMIRVVTFGSSTLIRDEGFQSVVNHVSVHDGVSSFFLEPMGQFRNYFDNNSNVFFHSHPDSSFWPNDHLLTGPTYTLIMRECGTQFLKEFQ